MNRYETPATRNVTSVRSGTRNWKHEPGICERCGSEFKESTSYGPFRLYCSDACKQAAYRARKAAT